MGKNSRKARAAWRAAAAAEMAQHPSSTSTEPSLVAAVTSAGHTAARDSRESTPASTQQQRDVHTRNARPAPNTSSAASHTTTASSSSATEHSSSTTGARSATACERERQPAAKPRGTREVHHANAQPAPQPASPASPAHTATPRDAPTHSGTTTRPRAVKNESNGLVGAREDCAHAPPARTAPHAPRPAQSAPPSTLRDVPAPTHNETTPTTPGFEPGGPRAAAASEPLEEPAPLDASQVDELVATALRKGYDSGLKEGRNSGFREGLQMGRKTGVESGKELGYEEGKAAGLKEGREQGRLEVSTTVRVASAVQTDDVSPPRVAHAMSPTDYASALPCHVPKSAPAPADHTSPSSRLATTLDAVDARLLQDVRGTSYDRGYDAGYHDGASDTCENLEWRLEERHSEGYSQGKEDGLRQLRDEQCDARKKIENTRFWEGFGQAQQLYGARAMLPAPERANAGTQTPMPPAVSCVDADAQTDAPPLRVDTASQATRDTHVDNAIDEIRENHKNNISRRDVSATAYDSKSHDVNHCTNTVPTVDNAASACFSWADDAEILPVNPTPPLPAPRDFSVLRSPSKTSPFGSLQRRARRAHRPSPHPPQRSWPRPVVQPALVVTRRHPAGLRAGRPSVMHVSAPSSSPPVSSLPLDWDGDPRLSELSRVLKSLGWVQS